MTDDDSPEHTLTNSTTGKGFKRKAWTLSSKDHFSIAHSKPQKVWTTWTRPLSYHLDFLDTYGIMMMESDSDDDEGDRLVKEECNHQVWTKVERIMKVKNLLTPPPVTFPQEAIALTSYGTTNMPSPTPCSTSEASPSIDYAA